MTTKKQPPVLRCSDRVTVTPFDPANPPRKRTIADARRAAAMRPIQRPRLN